MSRKKLPRSPYLNPRFSAALRDFGTAFLKTQAIKHAGARGAAREGPLLAFFRERLPSRYAVAKGEIVDLTGRTSPQLDLIFYDQTVNFTFSAEETAILPAEALLASIEVKTALTSTEITRSVRAALELRGLRPFGKALADRDVGSGSGKVARYFHCLFAYTSDLSKDGGLAKEHARLVGACGNHHLIDAVYVLDRGLINLDKDAGRLEDVDGGAITNFYFAILNFIEREARAEGPLHIFRCYPWVPGRQKSSTATSCDLSRAMPTIAVQDSPCSLKERIA